MNGSFEAALNDARPIEDPALPKVSATPYVWRDPVAIPRRPWIFGRQIMRGQVGGKFAPGGAGKTTHEVATCLSLATGKPILGQQVWGGPKRAWLWNLEDNGDELARIIQATALHWGITEQDVDGRLFVDSALEGATLKLATQSNMNGVIVHEPLADALIAELIARNIDYLSVDPFISSHSVEENDNGAIDAVVKKWAYIAKAANCGITLTHHVKKGQGEVTAEHARGASSLVAACRSALVLNRMSPQDAEKWGIPGLEYRRYFRVYDDKNNRAPPAETSSWFHLASVDLGNGTAEAPSDSLGVVEPWSPPDAFDDVTAEDLLEVQKLIQQHGNVRENSQAKRWVGLFVAKALGLDVTDKADRAKIIKLIRTWTSNGALRVFTSDDEKGNSRPCIEVGTWAVIDASTPRAPQVGKGGEGGTASGSPTTPTSPYRGGGVGAGKGASSASISGGEKSASAGEESKGLRAGSFILSNPNVPDDDDDDPLANFTA